MKISREWLQTFFDTQLPSTANLSDALIFHAFEVERVENDVLDVKVTANRGHDCLSHRGIAKELSAILNIPMQKDPLAMPADLSPHTDALSLAVENTALCPRHIICLIEGVKVAPSPRQLAHMLQAIGQRPINNIVDATNFAMYGIGQPVHVFDADRLVGSGTCGIRVRGARDGEEIELLGGVRKRLSGGMLVLADVHSDHVLDVAGIKGGRHAELTAHTRRILITAANFNAVSVRKTAHALKLRTDASSRFEQGISPELAAYGMRAAVDLILKNAGGTVAGYVDVYPIPHINTPVSISARNIRDVLGVAVREQDIADIFTRLGCASEYTQETWTVTPPRERLDIAISEDLIEEVGRIMGYDVVPAVELPPAARAPDINQHFYAAEKVREELIAKGYSEIYTSVFAPRGERMVMNKADGVRPYLRATLRDGLREAYEKNVRNRDILGLSEIKIFEIGTVWKDGKEYTLIGTADKNGITEMPLDSAVAADAYVAVPYGALPRYEPFSKYPFIVRDVSLWVPRSVGEEEVLEVIKRHAGDLLVRAYAFDTFVRDDRVSYAFRLIFQSFDRTLFDGDANERMASICAALKEHGWEVR